jgi:hypothetical protein
MQKEAFAGLPPGELSLPPGAAVTFYDVRGAAEPAWNVALTAFRVLPAAGGSYEVVVELNQYGRPRPVSVEAEGGGVADAAAGSWGQARFSLAGGRRYDFACPGGYDFDDRLAVYLPAAERPSYDVAAGTPGARSWEAAFAAVGLRRRASGEGEPPGVHVLPLSAWRSSRRGLSLAERGFVVVVAPDEARGGRFDEGTVLKEFRSAPSEVSADPALLANAARAGAFNSAGYMEVASSARWLAAASTADGAPAILERRMGKGEVYLLCLPAGREYSDLFTAVTFLGLVLDLSIKALEALHPAFAGARSYETPESDPAALGEKEVRRLFPSAAVTRNEPAGRPGRSFPLRSPAAAAVFVVLAAEVLLASYRPRPGAGGEAGRTATRSLGR